MRESVIGREEANPTARAKEKHEAKMTDKVPQGGGEDAKEEVISLATTSPSSGRHVRFAHIKVCGNLLHILVVFQSFH